MVGGLDFRSGECGESTVRMSDNALVGIHSYHFLFFFLKPFIHFILIFREMICLNISTIFLQQILSGRLLLVVIVGTKR